MAEGTQWKETLKFLSTPENYNHRIIPENYNEIRRDKTNKQTTTKQFMLLTSLTSALVTVLIKSMNILSRRKERLGFGSFIYQ